MRWRRKQARPKNRHPQQSLDIEEKVRFWEEQDRINKVLIPRVIRQHEVLKKLNKEHKNLPELFSRQLALEEQFRRFEKERKNLELVRHHARRDRLLRWSVIGAFVVSLTAIIVALWA